MQVWAARDWLGAGCFAEAGLQLSHLCASAHACQQQIEHVFGHDDMRTHKQE